MNVCS